MLLIQANHINTQANLSAHTQFKLPTLHTNKPSQVQQKVIHWAQHRHLPPSKVAAILAVMAQESGAHFTKSKNHLGLSVALRGINKTTVTEYLDIVAEQVPAFNQFLHDTAPQSLTYETHQLSRQVLHLNSGSLHDIQSFANDYFNQLIQGGYHA